MSSFAFTDRDTSPPRQSNGDTRPVTSCGGEWVCEHRYRETANMVGFRNAVGSAPVGDKWINGNQTAWGRGDKGYVVINRTDGTLSREFDSSVPAGVYCDVIDGDFDANAGTCSGRTVNVNAEGRFTAPVAGMDALAIHAGARLGAGPTPTVTPGVTTVRVHYDTGYGNRIMIRGDTAPLSWSSGLACVNKAAALWECPIQGIPSGQRFAFKPLINDSRWSTGPDHTGTAGQTIDVTPTF